ncbi:MAG: NADP-dependent oxidoreductase [Myxococcales bacterium]|nr:NADP-dependent oxidoreductase [Myxococcales bacterium]MCB9628378.1 NADP-dependent oxidoreductase [Sandaracinaceae bacterium]
MSLPQTQQQILLARRPKGVPVAEDFALATGPVPQVESVGPGQVLVRQIYLSLDPAIRGWMNESRSYLPPIALGAPVRSGTLSQVVHSTVPEWQPGDLCQALAAWEEYSLVPAQQLMGKITKVPGIPLSSMLNVLGGNGLTAYFGLYDVGQPKAGETVLVSAAAGGVGSIVGQLAKLRGCRVVGLTGSDDKCEWLCGELGFDAALNYKTANLSQQLKDVCPNGVDVFFDNVGGELLDLVLPRLALRGRVVVCGAISEINRTEPGPGLRNVMQLMAKRARMEGFVTLDYADRYAAARDELAGYVREGALKTRDEIVDGIEHAPAHLLRLFSGDHRGKLMVKVADPS